VSVRASVGGALIDRLGAHGGFIVVLGSAALAIAAALAALPTLQANAVGSLGPPDQIPVAPNAAPRP
jgi:hypothetical protein